LQAGNPTFRTAFQRRYVLCAKPQAHHLVEELGGFRCRKTQVCGPQFGQLASGAQTGQRQVWIFTGDDDQMHLTWQVLE
jgi:hypothetical protein